MERRRSLSASMRSSIGRDSVLSLGGMSDVSTSRWSVQASLAAGKRRLVWLLSTPKRNFRTLRARRFVFSSTSRQMVTWDLTLTAAGFYSAIYFPLALVFPLTRWSGDLALNSSIDLAFMANVGIKMRTSFRDRGYDVSDVDQVMHTYLRGAMWLDIIGAVPIDLLIAIGVLPDTEEVRVVGLVRVLRMLRITRIWHRLDRWTNAAIVRISGLMAFFLLLAHWCGLGWYRLAIRPLELSDDDSEPWFWLDDAGEPFDGGTPILYVCSLYWALSVMTNLKGLPAHESRQCLYHDPQVLHPLIERWYTICVFIIGALFFQIIYGNIQTEVANACAVGHRYSLRLGEINEFIRFHKLPAALTTKIRNYVEFAFSVTKGINVDGIAEQLPKHLQLEMHLHLNKKMVEQVRIFACCPRAFIRALVVKLQPNICVTGDYVICEGEHGTRMYFIRRGVAEVLVGSTVITTLREGDYFGEIALLVSYQKRTADVRAVTDCMLLSLCLSDFESVLEVFPMARLRIEAAAKDRLRKQDSSKSDSTRDSSSETSSTAGAPEAAQPALPHRLICPRRPSLAALRELSAVRESETERSSGDGESSGSCDKKLKDTLMSKMSQCARAGVRRASTAIAALSEAPIPALLAQRRASPPHPLPGMARVAHRRGSGAGCAPPDRRRGSVAPDPAKIRGAAKIAPAPGRRHSEASSVPLRTAGTIGGGVRGRRTSIDLAASLLCDPKAITAPAFHKNYGPASGAKAEVGGAATELRTAALPHAAAPRSTCIVEETPSAVQVISSTERHQMSADSPVTSGAGKEGGKIVEGETAAALESCDEGEESDEDVRPPSLDVLMRRSDVATLQVPEVVRSSLLISPEQASAAEDIASRTGAASPTATPAATGSGDGLSQKPNSKPRRFSLDRTLDAKSEAAGRSIERAGDPPKTASHGRVSPATGEVACASRGRGGRRRSISGSITDAAAAAAGLFPRTGNKLSAQEELLRCRMDSIQTTLEALKAEGSMSSRRHAELLAAVESHAQEASARFHEISARLVNITEVLTRMKDKDSKRWI